MKSPNLVSNKTFLEANHCARPWHSCKRG